MWRKKIMRSHGLSSLIRWLVRPPCLIIYKVVSGRWRFICRWLSLDSFIVPKAVPWRFSSDDLTVKNQMISVAWCWSRQGFSWPKFDADQMQFIDFIEFVWKWREITPFVVVCFLNLARRLQTFLAKTENWLQSWPITGTGMAKINITSRHIVKFRNA